MLCVYLVYKKEVRQLAVWSGGMIPASGAGGPGFNSRDSPWRAFEKVTAAMQVGSSDGGKHAGCRDRWQQTDTREVPGTAQGLPI